MYNWIRILALVFFIGGIIGGVFSFYFLKEQTFLLSLFVRIVDKPFQFRDYFSIVSGFAIMLAGFLWGSLFLGISEILKTLTKIQNVREKET